MTKYIAIVVFLVIITGFIIFASGCGVVSISGSNKIEKNGNVTYLCGNPDKIRADLKLDDLSELTIDSLQNQAIKLGMTKDTEKPYGDVGANCKLPEQPSNLKEFSFTNYNPEGGVGISKHAFIIYRVLHNEAGDIWLIDATYAQDGL